MKLCANEKTSAQRSIIGVCVWGGLSQVGCPFLGGLRSEWMKSGHGGRGGQKRPEMGGRPLYTVPSGGQSVIWVLGLFYHILASTLDLVHVD